MDSLEKQDDKAFSIMMKMGYKEGTGLGKNQTGMLYPINLPLKNDKKGFGHRQSPSTNKYSNSKLEFWDGEDKITIEEELLWLGHNNSTFLTEFQSLTYNDLIKFIVRGVPLITLDNETDYCDVEVLKTVLRTKEDVFLSLDAVELSKARTRANQFETIKSAFFMNRAALKMANIDAATNFMFTNIDKDVQHKKSIGPYYFADVCAGPGGFSEYILWRKRWSFKGFGFTLRGVHDFKLANSTCAPDVTFRGYYGSEDDGNVCNPSNIEDFAKKVLHETEQEGVHFMMADGGFSVEGNEGIQEILSKQIYICQCLVALEIVRKHGHFVTKLFDIFTAFSVGLLFLMYHCFEKVAILKPNSSRPANSERYFICSGLKDSQIVKDIRNYLRYIVKELWTIRDVNKESNIDILEIVPKDTIKLDIDFYNYIRSQNTIIARRQTKSLLKLAAFCKNSQLVDNKQVELRDKCLAYWHIPNKPRALPEKFTSEDVLNIAVSKPEFLYVQPCKITTLKELEKHILDVHDWTYIPLSSSRNNNSCFIFAGANGSTSYKLQNHKWCKVKGLKLVKGTLLYGEIVTEHCSKLESVEKIECKTLHVIDALRLGETSLADLPFNERHNLIRTYCQSINFETTGGQLRVRPKFSDKLANNVEESLLSYSVIQDTYYSLVPTIGVGSFREYFVVNSMLLLKTDESHYFNTTYVLRAQLFIDKFEALDENHEQNGGLRYDMLLQHIKDKL